MAVQRNRLDADRARTDTRNWAKARRDRTRHLIELGGLVIKADLVKLLNDDRATLLGALLDVADQLRSGREEGKSADVRTPAQLAATWRHRGLRAFEADKDSTAA